MDIKDSFQRIIQGFYIDASYQELFRILECVHNFLLQFLCHVRLYHIGNKVIIIVLAKVCHYKYLLQYQMI